MTIEDLVSKLKCLGFSPMFVLPTSSSLEGYKMEVPIVGLYTPKDKNIGHLVELSVLFDNAKVTNFDDVINQLNNSFKANVS